MFLSRRIRRTGATLSATLSAALLLAAGLLPAPAAQAQSLEFTAGSPGGSWFTQVTGISSILMEEIPGLSIRIVPGGGKDNPAKIQAGISQLGMGIDFLAKAAYDGKPPYDTPMKNLRTLGSTGVEAQFMVYVPKGETRSLDQLLADKSVRWGVPPAATSEYLTFTRSLDFYGSSPDAIRSGGGSVMIAAYSDLISAFGDGQIDALWSGGEIPSGIAQQIVAGRRAAKLLAFPKPLMADLSDKFGYGSSLIPAGTYPDLQDKDLPVSGMGNIYLIGADVPDDVAEKITNVLIRDHARFGSIYAALGNYDPAAAAKVTPVPMHPGAIKAFKAAGLMN